MRRLLIFSATLFVLSRLVRGWLNPPVAEPRPEPRELVQDPACSTYVAKSTALATRHGDRVLYFCSRNCQQRYLEVAG